MSWTSWRGGWILASAAATINKHTNWLITRKLLWNYNCTKRWKRKFATWHFDEFASTWLTVIKCVCDAGRQALSTGCSSSRPVKMIDNLLWQAWVINNPHCWCNGPDYYCYYCRRLLSLAFSFFFSFSIFHFWHLKLFPFLQTFFLSQALSDEGRKNFFIASRKSTVIQWT